MPALSSLGVNFQTKGSALAINNLVCSGKVFAFFLILKILIHSEMAFQQVEKKMWQIRTNFFKVKPDYEN